MLPALVCAVVEQESNWCPWAVRYEPEFRTRYVGPLGLQPTEEVTRSMSWGLMQIMGQVARERGFLSKALSELCSPDVGVEFGCIVLADKLEMASGDVSKGLQHWNGGGNQNYSAEVMSKIAKYT
jgi:hypothetical protein